MIQDAHLQGERVLPVAEIAHLAHAGELAQLAAEQPRLPQAIAQKLLRVLAAVQIVRQVRYEGVEALPRFASAGVCAVLARALQHRGAALSKSSAWMRTRFCA